MHEKEVATGEGQQDNTFEGSEDNQSGLWVSRFAKGTSKTPIFKGLSYLIVF